MLIRINKLVLQPAKSASTLSDSDNNSDAARLGVQRALSASAAPSAPFCPKDK